MNPSATGKWRLEGDRGRRRMEDRARRGEGRGGLSLRVLRIQAKRSCRVLVMAKKGRNGGTKEGRKEGRHFGRRRRRRRRRRAGHISGCRSHLRFFSSSDRPCHANSRRDLLSQGVLQSFPKNKKIFSFHLPAKRGAQYVCEIYGRKTYNSYSGMDCTYYSTYSYSIG